VGRKDAGIACISGNEFLHGEDRTDEFLAMVANELGAWTLL
jgi:hypothetical protein